MFNKKVVFLLLVIFINCGVIYSTQCVLRRRGITVIERNLILSYHNFIRSRIALGCAVPRQPKAGNMRIMIWDGQLANYAQNVANSCKFKGLEPKDPRWKNIGYNYFVVSPPFQEQTCSDWPRAIGSWWSLNQNYTYPNYNPKSYPYIQLVLAEAQYIGCGYSCFQQPNGRTLKLHLCFYGPSPSGLAEFPPYREGRGCPGLCN